MDSKYIFDKDLHLTFDVRIIMRKKRFIFGCIDHFYSHGQRLYKFFVSLKPLDATTLLTSLLSKAFLPRWDNTWAPDTVMSFWSADTLFWQLSIDHNSWIGCTISGCRLPHYSLRVLHFKLVSLCGEQTEGRAFGRMVMWLPKFLEWIDGHFLFAMGYI